MKPRQDTSRELPLHPPHRRLQTAGPRPVYGLHFRENRPCRNTADSQAHSVAQGDGQLRSRSGSIMIPSIPARPFVRLESSWSGWQFSSKSRSWKTVDYWSGIRPPLPATLLPPFSPASNQPTPQLRNTPPRVLRSCGVGQGSSHLNRNPFKKKTDTFRCRRDCGDEAIAEIPARGFGFPTTIQPILG